MKRYKILVQHELIMYAESEQDAEKKLLATPFMKARTNPQCMKTTEIPLPIDEPMIPIIDGRTAPGS
ncbi:MAG TPA: hypothetical protein VF077_09600 [Nitrospiraceae bacterium]